MIQEPVKEKRKSLSASINLFNKAKLPYSSTKYLFISKVSGAEMIRINDKDTAEQSTPLFNNAKRTKKKSKLQKKTFFKVTVELPPHSSFRVLSH